MLFKQIWLKIHARNRCAEERSAIFMEWFFNVWTTLDYIGSVSSSATPRNVYSSLQHMAKSFSQWSHVPLYRPQHKAVIYQNKWEINTLLPYTYQISHTSPHIRFTSLSLLLLKQGVISPLLLCPGMQVQGAQVSVSCLSGRSRVCTVVKSLNPSC